MKQTELWIWRLAGALFLVFNIYAEHSGRFLIGPTRKLLLALCFCALLTLSVRPWSGRRRQRVWLAILFAYYLWVLANILFFDAALGRGGGGGGVNLEPLRTVRNYLRAYALGNIRLELVILNLAGNLAAFAPMGVFLPALFRAQRNLLLFLMTIVLLVGAAEMVQYLTATGSCDIDDLILNTAGALAVWLLLLPWRLLGRQKEENS